MPSDAGEKKVITSAPPPWHSMLLLLVCSGVFLWGMPSLEKLDEAAKMETFARVIFPELLSLTAMSYIRAAIAACIWTVTFQMVTSKGWIQSTTYKTGSKLKIVPNHLVGIKTCFPFTSVSWNLLGIAFTLSAYISFQGAQGQTVAPWVLRIALASWEVAAPNSLLVASVIRYAIWPGVLAKGMPTTNLKSVRYDIYCQKGTVPKQRLVIKE